MDQFRVYTNIIRVGVFWRMMGNRLQMPSAIAVFLVFLAAAGLAFLLLPVSKTLGVIVIVAGVAIEALLFVFVGRMNNINGRARRGPQLRETTIARLIVGSVRAPTICNFDTPDAIPTSTGQPAPAVLRNY